MVLRVIHHRLACPAATLTPAKGLAVRKLAIAGKRRHTGRCLTSIFGFISQKSLQGIDLCIARDPS